MWKAARGCVSTSSRDARDCESWIPRVAGALAYGLIVFAVPRAAGAVMTTAAPVATMTTSAAQVFRGHCASATTAMVDVAGARVPVTTYTFQVAESLKGKHRSTVTFRQVGTPGGGPRDLGRLAGLPAYAPGTEYVLFLLPASRSGLTSPAGAADGAFVVHGRKVRRMAGARHARRLAANADADEPITYEALRQAVHAASGR